VRDPVRLHSVARRKILWQILWTFLFFIFSSERAFIVDNLLGR
jgi:hypothetical protein